MTTDNYRIQLETLLEENDQSWSFSLINRLARRANELQYEEDFTLSDIQDELEELVPHSQREDDDIWLDIIGEFAIFVNDEKEQNLDDEPEEDE